LLEIIPAERIEADCTVVAATEPAAVLSALIPQLLAFMLAAVVLLTPSVSWAALPPGNAVTDPEAILRDALPLQQSDLRDLQHRLENTSDDLRARRWSSIKTSCDRTEKRLKLRGGAITESFDTSTRPQAETLLNQFGSQLEELCEISTRQDRDAFLDQRRAALSSLGSLEALAVEGFPFTVPAEFDALPRLLGRATVAFNTTQGELKAVIDGFSAPLTGGAFVDLVQRGFYDGLPFTRAEDFYVLQTGDPKGDANGYVDPGTKQERLVPLEIMVPGDDSPIYNMTFEDLGLFKTTPTLPFATLGTLGWAHSDEALDDGSSQFFFFLYEAELTPAGLNLVDGRYAAFGYVVDGSEALKEMGVDDRIISATVLDGADNLKPHA
jgi:peptidylprolyl isomerase